MRTQAEMFALILGWARDDERIRAALLEGSRAGADEPGDAFQDYDVVLLVTSVAAFRDDRSWIRKLGDLIIMQTPDEMGQAAPRDGFGFLMLFTDGNRIDVQMHPVDRLATLELDVPNRLLLDKDGVGPRLAAARQVDHRLAPPSAKRFADCCNEFWWVSTYVAKGLWRRQLPYAKAACEETVRPMLTLMLRWHVIAGSGGRADAGKMARGLQRYLSPTRWQRYVDTFADGDYDRMWRALLAMGDLFREVATEVAGAYGFPYAEGDDARVTAYLQWVRKLPPAAAEI